MSQVQPGDDGTRQRPGAPAGKGSPTKSAPAKTPAKRPPTGVTKGRPPTNGAKGRPPTGGGKGRPPTGGGGKGRGKPNMQITAAPPRRFSPSTLAFASIALVVVIVLVFVVVTVTGGKGKTSSKQLIPDPVPAPASLVAEVTGVSPAITNAVGTGVQVTAPSALKGQPKLTGAGGKPELLFIGAEFCPFCAAERWAMVEALSRFGTWSGLEMTTSSLWDTDPGTATFTFRNATFTSQYIDFVSSEHETNDNFGSGTRKLFQPLTSAASNLWQKYSQAAGQTTGYPFVDFGNKVVVLGPSYDPAILAGLDQQEIAAKLKDPTDPVTEAIIGTANYLTASICAETGNQPAPVCSAAGVKKAATAMKLS